MVLLRDLPNPYLALEVTEDSDEATIKKAYRRLVMKWHPDKNPTARTLAEEKIRLLNTSYETLSNPVKRETYDLQRSALSKKRKGGPAKPRSAAKVDTPKQFMMQPLGYPESFVRSVGKRVLIQSRSDASDVDFQNFFSGTKLAIWWLPEVNNMCRIRGLGSKARGDRKGAAAGTAGGLNLSFDSHAAKKGAAEGIEVKLTPANKGQKADSVNFVCKASPTCEGGIRFESASERGHYLAFFPPTHLRVVPFLEITEDRVLDFLVVDFASMFKFITMEEVFLPVVGKDQIGEWFPLTKMQEDDSVQKHFSQVLGKPVWEAEDFQAYFEGHFATWEYNFEEQLVRLRPKHEQLAKQLRSVPKANEVVAAVAKAEEEQLKQLPLGALARALSSLAGSGALKDKEDDAEMSGGDMTSAQIRLLAALRHAGDQETGDLAAMELLASAEQVLSLGGDNPDDTVLVQRSAAARILATKALEAGLALERGLEDAGFTLAEILRLLHLPGAAGRDASLSQAVVKLLDAGTLAQQMEVLRVAISRGSTNTASAAGTAILKTLTAGFSPGSFTAASDASVDAVKEVLQVGVRLPAAAALLRRFASSARASNLADALLVLAQRAGPGQADDLRAAADSLGSKGAFSELSQPVLLQLALASSKNEALDPVVAPVATSVASRLTEWPGGDVVKLLLAMARRRALLSGEAREALRQGAEAALKPRLGKLSPDDLAGLVLAALAHGWAALREAAVEHLLSELPDFPAKPLLLVTPTILQ
ncbi:unnamed protein product, partial [Polarella glacialis]